MQDEEEEEREEQYLRTETETSRFRKTHENPSTPASESQDCRVLRMQVSTGQSMLELENRFYL